MTRNTSQVTLVKRRLPLIIGASLILLIALIAVLAPLLTSHDPKQFLLTERYTAPSAQHLFGQDQNGTDVFAQVVYGARTSLSIALSVVGISVLIGLIFGSLTGYFGGWTDQVVMRIIDMLYAFPGFLLALTVVAILGPSLQNLVIALCITGWTGYARLVRGELLYLKEKDFVNSARALGAGSWRIIILHLWPNLVGPVVVQATFGLAGTLISESALSFLGLGAPPSEPTWGALLNAGRKTLVEAPHVSFFPGLFIVILVLGFNLFGDGLRDWLDPKRKNF